VPVKIEPFHLGHFDAVGREGPLYSHAPPSYFNLEVGGVHTISNRHVYHRIDVVDVGYRVTHLPQRFHRAPVILIIQLLRSAN